jgi:hypothetical protein
MTVDGGEGEKGVLGFDGLLLRDIGWIPFCVVMLCSVLCT